MGLSDAELCLMRISIPGEPSTKQIESQQEHKPGQSPKENHEQADEGLAQYGIRVCSFRPVGADSQDESKEADEQNAMQIRQRIVEREEPHNHGRSERDCEVALSGGMMQERARKPAEDRQEQDSL